MISFDELVITDIRNPKIVYSQKGDCYKMENRQYFGVCFSINGQITYTMNGKKYISRPDNAILVPRGCSYCRVTDSEGQFPLINFFCSGLDLTEIAVIPLDNPQDFIRRFRTMQQMFLRNESRMKIYSTFYELLDSLVSPNEQSSDQLTRVEKYIEEHIQDPTLSNVELAKCLGISEVYLRKQFQTHYRVTPKQYILDIRIRKAKQLLVDTPFTVTAIAEECGFSSVYHFCRSFRQRTGKTPTQYAAENRTYQI